MYDQARRRAVLFGGASGLTFPDVKNDTWEWDGTAWEQRTTSVAPSPRTSHAMFYDASASRIVLFGGALGGTLFGDTWQWTGTTWTNISPQSAPSNRSGHVMTYDALHREGVMFGGFGGSNDTWRFQFTRSGTNIEQCALGLDGDGDGQVGCDDSDCFGVCSPVCNPTSMMTCDAQLLQCGDGTCTAVESPRTCPADCGAASRVCGDFLCDSPETAATCPGDCP